jgi:hypothetical protein
MIRIIGIQRSPYPEREFVLLQNQGVRRIPLDGYVVTDDLGLHAGDPYVRGDRIFTFPCDIKLAPSNYLALITGWGEDGWRREDDGTAVYHCYWGRERSVWHDHDGPMHLLATTNSYAPRSEAYVLRR